VSSGELNGAAGPYGGGDQGRERLLAAMEVEAGERGYRRCSAEGVARRAGLGPARFADEFDSLEECFLAAWDRVYERFVARCIAAYQRPGSWRDRLRAAAEEFCSFVEEDPGAARVLLVELLEAGPRARARRDLGVRSFASLFDAGRAELEDPGSLPYEVAQGIAGSIFVTLRAQLIKGSGSPRDLMDELMCIAVMPYLGVDAAMGELEEEAGGESRAA
jgi:AcrR family transcriptional regulator